MVHASLRAACSHIEPAPREYGACTVLAQQEQEEATKTLRRAQACSGCLASCRERREEPRRQMPLADGREDGGRLRRTNCDGHSRRPSTAFLPLLIACMSGSWCKSMRVSHFCLKSCPLSMASVGTERHECACIICLDSDPPPIQSGCACRSDTGLAHVGCLIEKAVAQRPHRGNAVGVPDVRAEVHGGDANGARGGVVVAGVR